jgi:hypothetical protein
MFFSVAEQYATALFLTRVIKWFPFFKSFLTILPLA